MVDKTWRTYETGSSPSKTEPILDAIEIVRIPAILSANTYVVRAVFGGSTVCVDAAVFVLAAVVVAVVAHWAVATVDEVRVVTIL